MSANSIKGAVRKSKFVYEKPASFKLFQDFRAQKSLGKGGMEGWLKYIGKLGLPAQLLLKFYQLTIMWFDLVYMSLIAYKEMWLSLFYAIFPIPKKTLVNEVAVVSSF